MRTILDIALILGIEAAAAYLYVMTGIEHAVVYHYHSHDRDGSVGRQIHPALAWWNVDVHRSGNRIHRALAACLFGAIILVAGQGQGWEGYAAALPLTMAPFLIGEPFRQAWINLGSSNHDDHPEWWEFWAGLLLLALGTWMVTL